MSLANCIKQFGADVSLEVIDGINATVEQLTAEGATQADAEAQAVQAYATQVDTELEAIATQAEELGATVTRGPETPLSKINVTINAIEEETGREVQVQERADVALNDIDTSINELQEVIKCLGA